MEPALPGKSDESYRAASIFANEILSVNYRPTLSAIRSSVPFSLKKVQSHSLIHMMMLVARVTHCQSEQ